MLKLLLRRLIFGAVTLLIVSVLVFIGTELLPGDVAQAILGQNATPETVAALRSKLDLDQPAPLRYLGWLAGLANGQLGESLATGREISGIIAARLPNTILLAGVTAAIAVPVSMFLGLLAAVRRTITATTLCLLSGPEFLIATLLVMLFSVHLHLLPAVSNLSASATFLQTARALALPVATLTAAVLAPMTRMTRSTVINVLASPAIEMALLKGVPRWRIIAFHALPNAIGPILSVIALNLAYLVSSVVVVEVVFTFPGMAKLMVDSVSVRDIPTVQACAMIFCAAYVGLNLLADLLAIAGNPRLRHPK